MKKDLDDSKLNLDQIETALRGMLTRLREIRAECETIHKMRPTRQEVHDALMDWLDRQVKQSSDALFSRLNLANFLVGPDKNHRAGILFSGSSASWSDQSVEPAGLMVILADTIRAHLEKWVSELDNDLLGTMTAEQKTARLDVLEAERASIIERRRLLQDRLQSAVSAGKPPHNPDIFRGGTPGTPGLDDRLEEKLIAAM